VLDRRCSIGGAWTVVGAIVRADIGAIEASVLIALEASASVALVAIASSRAVRVHVNEEMKGKDCLLEGKEPSSGQISLSCSNQLDRDHGGFKDHEVRDLLL
jgi:hypothetical protein